MKKFLNILLISLFSLISISCNKENISYSEEYSYSSSSSYEIPTPTSILTNIRKIKIELEKVLEMTNKDEAINRCSELEALFLTYGLDIPITFEDNENTLNYMAININRTSYNNTSSSNKDRSLTASFLKSQSFRNALMVATNKEKLVNGNIANTFTNINGVDYEQLVNDNLYFPLSYDKEYANYLFSLAKKEIIEYNGETIYLDVIVNKNSQFIKDFKENIEEVFDKQIIINIIKLDNFDFYTSSEVTFDYDINPQILWRKESEEITAYIYPLLSDLLKYNGIDL